MRGRCYMTREQILAMQPGRELDVLVAEKVFKKTIMRERRPNGEVYMNRELENVYIPVPYYSTDLSTAWEVLDKVTNKRHTWELANTLYSDKREEFDLTIFLWSSTVALEADDNASVTADTIPEAICKCALLAVLHG